METLSVQASDGVHLAAYRDGRGLPLYALHGGPATDHRAFGHYLDPATEYAELVLLDQRGCGGSDDAPPESYTLERLAADIEDVRESLGHERVVLLAHSFGGAVAVRYAIRWPERLLALIFVDASASGWKGPLLYVPGWLAWYRAMRTKTDFNEFHLAHEVGNPEKREEVRALLKMESRHDPLRVQPLTAASYRSLPLRKIAAKVRFYGIYGQADRRFLGDARQLRRAGANVLYIKDAGHFPFVEQPAVFHATVRQIVASCGP
jgi:pimeloyl-ACP methyl ester carboxylesterase